MRTRRHAAAMLHVFRTLTITTTTTGTTRIAGACVVQVVQGRDLPQRLRAALHPGSRHGVLSFFDQRAGQTYVGHAGAQQQRPPRI